VRAFHELAHREILLCRRHGRPLSVIYLDVDNFKAVNDSLGHSAGDRLLNTIAQVMKSSTRATDIVSRCGGDEFVVLLTETGGEAARSVVDKLRIRLAEAILANGLNVTFSIGVVTWVRVPDSVDALLRHADQLMYSVKSHAKDGVLFSEVA
jgi:diguanylate cyclase (GGDEF)-like protein